MTTSPALLLFFACTGGDAETTSSLEAIEADQAVRVALADAAGVGVIEVPVRLVNRYGASVPGGSVDVALDTLGFSLQSSTISLDAEGFGLARVVAAQPGSFQLTVVGSSDGAETGAQATGIALGAEAPTLMLDRVLPRPPSLSEARAMARGTRGLALVDDGSVWWLPSAPGAVGWQVLETDFEILGTRAVEVDADGVRDLVVWGEQAVIVLRGRPDGGYAWGAGWTSPDMQVVGVSVDDQNGDQLADIVVGQTSDEVARIEMLLGDGVWGFQAVAPLELTSPIMDMVTSDEDSDGRPDVTVIDAQSGWLRRYTRTDGRWTGNAPSLLDSFAFPLGSRLLAPADLNGDGVRDVIGISGPSSGVQKAVFYILAEDNKYEQAYAEIQADVSDVDGDGAADLLLMESGLLHRVRYDAELGGFVIDNLSGLADTGPIASGDIDGDGIADVAVLEDGIVLHIGDLDEAGAWSIGRPSLLELATGLDGPYLLQDLNGDGRQDLIGVVTQDDGQGLRIWLAGYSSANGPSYTTTATLALNATGGVHDLANCGTDYYVLSDNAAAGLAQPDKAFRIRLATDGSYAPVVQNSGSVTGTLLDCGYPQTATEKRFLVASTSGTATTYAYEFSVIAEEQLGPVVAVAFADTDGDDLDELYTCAEADCELIGEDLDDDGIDELIQGGPQVVVEGWNSSYDLGLAGSISVGDLDGDGLLDVLAVNRSTGRISAVPTLTGAMGPASGWYTTEAIDGAVLVTDYDRDGRQELVFRRGNQLIGTLRTVLPTEQ